MGKGLKFDVIAQAALALTIEQGYGNFTMRELAKELHVKAASLYNYINGIDDINIEIGRIAAGRLGDCLNAAAESLPPDDALRAVAHAWRNFVRDNPQLYDAIMNLPALAKGNEAIIGEARQSLEAIRTVLRNYELDQKDSIYFSRCFRSALNGFIAMERSGYYSAGIVTVEDSFEFLIRGHIDVLHQLEEAYRRDHKSWYEGK